MTKSNQDQQQQQIEQQWALGTAEQSEIQRAKETQDNIRQQTAEQQLTQVDSKVDASTLAVEVQETQRYNNKLHTLEMLEWTNLKTTMLKVLSHPDFNNYTDLKDKSPEQRLEVIFRKINIVLTKFLERKFNIDSKEPIPDHLKNVVIPAMERYLMDILKESGHDTNVNFLWEISSLNMDSISSLFQWVNNFSKKFTVPFRRWKSLLNAVDFLSLPKNQEQTKKLKNPYELYEKVLNNPIFQNTFITEGDNAQWIVNINTITWEQFWLSDLQWNLSEDELNKKLQEWKQKIQSEIGSIQMVESPDTVKKLLWVLNNADTFLTSTKKMWDSMIDSIDSLWNTAQAIDHTFWFNAREMLKNLEKYPVIGGVITLVLSLLWFSWGVGGIEKTRKKRQLDKEMTDEKKNYITEVYNYYMKNKQTDTINVNQFLLEKKLNIPEQQKDKFKIDINLIESQISKKIEENGEIINPSTLLAIQTNTFNWKDFVQEVTENNKKVLKLKKTTFTEEERRGFISWYVDSILQYYSNVDHLNKLKDADSLAFSMIAWITLNKDNVIDGLEAEVFLPSQFYETSNNPASVEESENPENQTVKYWEELNYVKDNFPESKKQKIETELVNSPISATEILSICKTENIPVEYILAIFKQRCDYWKVSWANEKKNPGNLLDSDQTVKKFDSWNDWITALAKDIKKRTDNYETVYWKKTDKTPWIWYLLENKWPDNKWFINGVDNYKQLNEYQETTPPKWAFIEKKEELTEIENKVNNLKQTLNQ